MVLFPAAEFEWLNKFSRLGFHAKKRVLSICPRDVSVLALYAIIADELLMNLALAQMVDIIALNALNLFTWLNVPMMDVISILSRKKLTFPAAVFYAEIIG